MPKKGKAPVNDLFMRQLPSFICFEAGQRKGLLAVIKDPHIDFEREEAILQDYILALGSVYKSKSSVAVNE